MKKRSIITATVATVLLLALIFSACGKKDPIDENNADTETTETDIYTILNTMMGNVGYPVTLKGKTTEGGYVFNSTYAITENAGTYSVDYSYEKLSTFDFTDDGQIIVPENFKTTLTGNVKVREGKIIEQNGSAINVSVDALDIEGITLSAAALSNVQTEDGKFTADISAPATVFGSDFSGSNAKIEIQYTDTKITKMVLSYSTSSYQSEITYLFS